MRCDSFTSCFLYHSCNLFCHYFGYLLEVDSSRKRFYDFFCQQGVSCEPFVPLLGQLPEIRRASETDSIVQYRLELVQKHGYVYVIGFGPSIRLVVIEPDMLADIFGRSHAQHYQKLTDTAILFKPLIGVRNLLVSEGSEHTRA